MIENNECIAATSHAAFHVPSGTVLVSKRVSAEELVWRRPIMRELG